MPRLSLSHLEDHIKEYEKQLVDARAELRERLDEELVAAEGRLRLLIASKACHEANRVLTALVKDVPVQPTWEHCGIDMQESCVKGVSFAFNNPDATPERQHEAWMRERIEQGWVFGEVKDPEKKTHPALRPYSELSEGTRLKDAVFQAIVRAFR
jgi:hypothetical protein